MKTKLFELRDRATFIPVMAVQLSPSDDFSENYLLRRAGFWPDNGYVILCRLECSGINRNATYDAFAWGQNPRTFTVAHQFIEKNFDTLAPGAVVDVEFILGETSAAKTTERSDDAS